MATDETRMDLEVTEEQCELLRELGVSEARIRELDMAAAQELIEALVAEREATRT
jgi:hypothetical protein